MTLTDQPGHPLPFLVSTVLSVTAIARTSLFASKLACDTSTLEKQNFAAHAALLAVSRSAYPPVLFHKGELLEGSSRAVVASATGAATGATARARGGRERR